MKTNFSILLVALCTLSSARAADDERSSPQLHCGAYCLYLGLNTLDLPLKNYKELEDKLGQPGEFGYSMEQLSEAARSFGAYSLGVETSLENLRRRPRRFVCIALLKQGHFVNLYDATDDRVFLVDPPNLRQVGLDGFRATWTGKALLISDQAIPDESSLRSHYEWGLIVLIALAAMAVAGVISHAVFKRRHIGVQCLMILIALTQGCRDTRDRAHGVPSIQVEPGQIDLGPIMIARDGELTTPVLIKNRGTGDLRIFSVQSSCGCTIVQAPASDIAAGHGCSIQIVVRPGIQPGPRESVLTIQCSDPVTPLIRLPITWSCVSGLTCDPSEVDLGRLRPGQRVERKISVGTTAEVDVRDVQAQTTTPGLVLEWERSENESGDRGRKRNLIVRFTAGSTEGGHTTLIALIGEKTDLATMVPARWKVAPRVSIHPTALFSSSVEPKSKVTAHLILQSEDKEIFGIKSVTNNNENCHFTLESGESRSESQHVRVEAIAPDVSGTHRLSVRIETDLPGEKPILIPWSMTVR